jgi:hypothetical protein
MKPHVVRWYVPLLLLTLFAPSLQLFFVLIHSHVGSPESDVDYVVGTMNELAKSSSIHPIKTMRREKVMVKRFKEKGSIPPEELLKCVQRDINTDEDMEIFRLYWEEFLCKQVGEVEWEKTFGTTTRFQKQCALIIRAAP